MQSKFRRYSVLFLLFSAVFCVYQETAAQGRRARPSPSPTVAAVRALPEIGYTISMSRPHTHLLEVEMRVKWAEMPVETELKMPVWTPGSYLIREYARHVQTFSAKDGGGATLGWEKINKNTWKIDTRGVKDLVIRYRVYSDELTVRTNELNNEHAFWNNAALLMFVKGQLSASSTVKVIPYNNWRVATGLKEVAGSANTFFAENFDILYDSPFEVSDFKEHEFLVRGVPHRYVVTGEGNYDLERLAADTAKIIEEGVNIFGDLPYENYTLILNLRGGGGLEHLNSTALQANRFAFTNEARYKGFLSLVAHEFFHVWNVKRIRPDTLGPFDYENENYTKLLWVAEGSTSYYEGVMLRRAGLITDRELLVTKASLIKALQERPGRFETSLEEASLDAWIKFYRQDANAINNQISYYDKGEIVSMMLDITIRTASGGQKSLDDVFRYLYNEIAKKGKNFSPEDFKKASELMAGQSLSEFFKKYVSGRDEIDYSTLLNGIGLELSSAANNMDRAFIGANLAEDAGRLLVRSIPSDTPAYDQGLNFGDHIVAIDGYRASQAFLNSYLNDRKPGETVRLSVFRHDRLFEIQFKLGSDFRKDYRIIPVAEPNDLQRKLYREYLNADL